MTLFLDSSALAKRYLREEGTEVITAAMQDADEWIASRIAFVEMLRVVASDPAAVTRHARADWERVDVVEVDQHVCERAVELTFRHALKSMDAIHLASALSVSAGGLVFATWDRRLHAAAVAVDLETIPAELP